MTAEEEQLRDELMQRDYHDMSDEDDDAHTFKDEDELKLGEMQRAESSIYFFDADNEAILNGLVDFGGD